MEGTVVVWTALISLLPGMSSGMPPNDLAAAAGVQASSSSSYDLYSESPCELRPLSAYKDMHGNVWGFGDGGDLWWFNATNLSWSLLPLPNGTSTSAPWRVACADPRRWVALVGRNATLVLHLPWQHWRLADTDDVSLGYVDASATWCSEGSSLFGVDPLRETLYLLDPGEAHWTVVRDLPVADNVNWSSPLGVVNTWVGPGGELVLVERFGEYRHVVYTNASGIDWVVAGEKSRDAPWPDLDSPAQSLAWNLGSGRMWLWLEEGRGQKHEPQLWFFNGSRWERGGHEFAGQLPRLDSVLTAWREEDKYCVLVRNSDCTAQYTTSDTLCWSEDEMIPTEDQPPLHPTTDEHLLDSTSPPTPPLQTTSTELPSGRFETKHPPPTHAPPPERASDVVVSTRLSPWHQHTSVFGSVVFFGTSLTIFGLVGFFWCLRKCVHFPKEALLLRDPPSVRYTAIPDSLNGSRKPAYAVIPDTIA